MALFSPLWSHPEGIEEKVLSDPEKMLTFAQFFKSQVTLFCPLGDRLRGQYQALSQDPNSLANLDQDLPNNMIHQVPIFSLPQVSTGHIMCLHLPQ